MNYNYLESYCNDLIKSAIELQYENENIIKGLNISFLDITSKNVSYSILLKRLKHYERQILAIRQKRLFENEKFNKRALIISDNENDSSYFNSMFKNFTCISLKTTNKKQIDEYVSFTIKGNISFIYSTIELEIPEIESKFSIIISNQKAITKNNPTIEIYNSIPLIESNNSVSKLLFLSCSSMYQNMLDISMLKSLSQCNILINGNYTLEDKFNLNNII